MATRDWLAIKTEYVTGEISLRDLAQKHRVPDGSVRRVADTERWIEERETYRAKLNLQTAVIAEKMMIDVRREILESFAESRKAWLASSRKADDFAALSRLAASISGLDTEHGTQNVNLADWRAGKSADEIAAIEEAARIVNERNTSSTGRRV